MARERYLGDGVYAEDDGIQVRLVADGTKIVYLGPGELAALLAFVRDDLGWEIP